MDRRRRNLFSVVKKINPSNLLPLEISDKKKEFDPVFYVMAYDTGGPIARLVRRQLDGDDE